MKKLLLKILDQQEKMFEKGGKLEKLYPLFEAGQSFLFSTKETTKSTVHVRDNVDTKRWMIIVVLALLPCTLFGVYNAGYQSQLALGLSLDHISVVLSGLKSVLPIILVSYAVGGICEAIFSVIRNHEINEGFLVTGLLFPLTLPTTTPLWQVALGIVFGVIIGKEVFGGTGRNFLNPALTARAFLYFAFPVNMSGEVWTYLGKNGTALMDGWSGATPLGITAIAEQPETAEGLLLDGGYSISKMFYGLVPGSIGETSVLMCLIGAIILIVTGVASYRTIVGCVIGLVVMTGIFNFFAGPTMIPAMALSPVWQMVIGSFAFGAVFMATDPVSSPDLESSRWIYGFFIGVLTVIIRVANPAYPEGVMLAILLMNVFAPLIDHTIMQRRSSKRIPNVI